MKSVQCASETVCFADHVDLCAICASALLRGNAQWVNTNAIL